MNFLHCDSKVFKLVLWLTMLFKYNVEMACCTHDVICKWNMIVFVRIDLWKSHFDGLIVMFHLFVYGW